MAVIYHRTLGGKVTYIDAMTRDEIEEAIERAPWEWSADLKSFASWPAGRARGVAIDLPSTAADFRLRRVHREHRTIFEGAHNRRKDGL
jgi:hypothetical protein